MSAELVITIRLTAADAARYELDELLRRRIRARVEAQIAAPAWLQVLGGRRLLSAEEVRPRHLRVAKGGVARQGLGNGLR